jgi:metal-dependent amidase/aminoacylase/carboxypeptidase family protein
VIPAHTAAKYIVRAKTLADLDEIKTKVLRCFEAGALATGSTLDIFGGQKPYAEHVTDPEIAALYQRNAEILGRVIRDLGPARDRAAGSTDMGNVSLAMPSIHPFIGIDSLPAVNHQPEFTAHCATPAADKAVLDGGLAMAWTAIDLATDAKIRDRLLQR